jgi:hypothetical protein
MNAARSTPLFLTDTDVTREILKHVGHYDELDTDGRRKARVDLVSAALCCTGFKDASLDLLWYTMYSIVPVLRLIPGIQEIQGKLVRPTMSLRHLAIFHGRLIVHRLILHRS